VLREFSAWIAENKAESSISALCCFVHNVRNAFRHSDPRSEPRKPLVSPAVAAHTLCYSLIASAATEDSLLSIANNKISDFDSLMVFHHQFICRQRNPTQSALCSFLNKTKSALNNLRYRKSVITGAMVFSILVALIQRGSSKQ